MPDLIVITSDLKTRAVGEEYDLLFQGNPKPRRVRVVGWRGDGDDMKILVQFIDTSDKKLLPAAFWNNLTGRIIKLPWRCLP